MMDKSQPLLDFVNKIIFKFCNARLIIHSEIIKSQFIRNKAKAVLKNQFILCNHAPPEIVDKYEIKDIDLKIRSFFEKNDSNLKYLFFGDIRPSKGIDIFMEMANSNAFSNDKFLCVGQDSFDIVSNAGDVGPNFFFENRRVSDSELHFLFTNSDYLVLPYQAVSQSGVLEAGVHLQCKIICSNVFLESLTLKNYEKVIVFDFFHPQVDFNLLKKTISKQKTLLTAGDITNYSSYDSLNFKQFILNIGSI